MIDFKGKNCGDLHELLRRKRLKCEEVTDISGVRTWVTENEAAVQAEIDAFDFLAATKKLKRQEIKAEAVKRLQVIDADIDNIKDLTLFFALWNSVRAAAVIDPDWQRVLNIRTAMRNAIQTVNGYTTAAEVQAYNVVTMPGWPA